MDRGIMDRGIMDKDIERILISRDRITRRVEEMAVEISETYRYVSHGLVIVSILAGAVIFLADLIRLLPMKMKIALMNVSSYPGATTESQGPRIITDLNLDLENRHVLLLDDILDTGNTLRLVREEVAGRNPASLRICVLLRKPGKAPADLHADFVGFDIEDKFVVGYGLDYNDEYRNFPHIGVLRADLYHPNT